MRKVPFAALLALLLSAPIALSQVNSKPPYHSRLNAFGFFGEYSNDSSHIFLGMSQNRKLLDFGGFYSRRVLLNHFVEGDYLAEFRPVMYESDPLVGVLEAQTSPPPVRTLPTYYITQSGACQSSKEDLKFTDNGVTYTDTVTIICGKRQWTFGEGFSPAGFKLNFLPQRRLQPVFTVMTGYMFSTKPIPVSDGGSANFTFAFGAGFEYYRTPIRSIRVEYRIHHISNADSADENPGIDNQVLQVTYSFGH